MKGDLFADASRLSSRATSRRGYALAYGSHAKGRAAPRSDLDLLVVDDGSPSRAIRVRLIEDVKHLHQLYGLDLDEEVPYAVKLYASAADVAAAAALGGFSIDHAGNLSVPHLTASPEYLASTPFKLRLILNALTSPHVFLGGHASRFERDRRRARLAITLLALSILGDRDTISAPLLAAVLIRDPRAGATGKDYLGYTDDDLPHLYDLVQQSFACLASMGVLHPVDGATLDQRHNVRRSLLLRMARRRRRLRPGIANEGGCLAG